MRREQKEIIKLTSAKFLLTLFEAIVTTAKPFFEASSIYRKSINNFNKTNRYDKTEINDRIQYLKRMGFIKTFVEGKEKFIELSPTGFKKLKQLSEESIISHPNK